MEAPKTDPVLVEWARDNNVKDILPVLVERGYLTLEAISQIDKKYVVRLWNNGR